MMARTPEPPVGRETPADDLRDAAYRVGQAARRLTDTYDAATPRMLTDPCIDDLRDAVDRIRAVLDRRR